MRAATSPGNFWKVLEFKDPPDPFYNLNNNKNIVFKAADKGSAVVVWDRGYIKEAEKQLRDIKHFIKQLNISKLKIQNVLGSICYLKYIND